MDSKMSDDNDNENGYESSPVGGEEEANLQPKEEEIPRSQILIRERGEAANLRLKEETPRVSRGLKREREDGSLSPMGRQKAIGPIVWTHIVVEDLPSGLNGQTCKYCKKHKSSKQLQTTFWTQHLVDSSERGCPLAPEEVRLALLNTTRSASVRRLVGGETLPPLPSKEKAADKHRQRKKLKKGREVRIVCICGSQRESSFNRMLLEEAMTHIRNEGASVKLVDLKALDLPIYDADLEGEKFPLGAAELKGCLTVADGICIVSPEYNGFTSPLLLNAITWATRGEGRMYAGFKGKVVCLMSASPGTMGGMRMLRSLTTMMQDMGALVAPGNNSIGNAYHVFDRQGNVVDDRAMRKISASCFQFVSLVRAQAEAKTEDCDYMEKEVAKIPNMGEYGRAEW